VGNRSVKLEFTKGTSFPFLVQDSWFSEGRLVDLGDVTDLVLTEYEAQQAIEPG